MSHVRAHCASCQSENVSEPTEYAPHQATVRFAMNDANPGWLEASQETFHVTRARPARARVA